MIVDFFSSFLWRYSRFSIANKPYPLISQKYPTTFFFYIDIITLFLPLIILLYYCFPILLIYYLFHFLLYPNFFSLEMYLSRLDSIEFYLSKLDFDLKSLYSSEKFSSSPCFFKNLLFRWFSLSIFRLFLVYITHAMIRAKYCLHCLLSPIVNYLVLNC